MTNARDAEAFGKSGVPSMVIENPLSGGRVAVPVEVRRDGDWLLWRKGESDPPLEGFVEGAPVDTALWEFLELRDAPPEAYLEFAQRFGVMALRADGLPATTQDTWNQRRAGTNVLPPFEKTETDPPIYWYKESIPALRMYAVGLRAVLAFAIELRRAPNINLSSVIRNYGLDRYTWDTFGLPISDDGKSASNLYYRWIGYHDPGFILHNLSRFRSEEGRQWLAYFITSTWIAWGGLTPIMTWVDGMPRMTISLGPRANTVPLPSNTLSSVLAAQLAALVASPEFERLDRCSVCGRLFAPQKKPGRHDRAYCPDHKLEGERERKRRWARKQAAKKRAQTTT